MDFVIGLVALEALGFAAWRVWSGRGPRLLPFLSNLLSGAFLMLALRNALAGASWLGIAPCLAASLAAHLVDLRWRWSEAAEAGKDTSKAAPSPRAMPATISLRAPKRAAPRPTDGASRA